MTSSFSVDDLITKRLTIDGQRIQQLDLGALVVSDPTYGIGIGTDTPRLRLDISGTNGIRIPVGTTGERPQIGVNDIVDLSGVLRYNTTLNQYEAWALDGWQALGGSSLQLYTKEQGTNPTIKLTKEITTYGSNDDGGIIEFCLKNQSNSLTYQARISALDSTNNAGYGSLVFSTSGGGNPQERMRIDHTGNVGIIENLTVGGDISGNDASFNDVSGVNFFGGNFFGDLQGNAATVVNGPHTNITGVGTLTSSPETNRALHVSGNIKVEKSGAVDTFVELISNNKKGYLLNNDGTLKLNTEIPSNNLILQGTGGNVGIGTSSPRATFNVSRNISNNSAGTTIPSNYGGNDTTTCVLGMGLPGSTQNYYGLNIGTVYRGDSYIQSCHTNSSSFYDILLNPKGGNVGIGTDLPNRKFEMKEQLGTVGFYSNYAWSDGNYNNLDTGFVFNITGNGSQSVSIPGDSYILKKLSGFYIDSYDTLRLNASSAHNVRICEGGGNVSIGPNENNDYKLYVLGPTWLNGEVGCAYNSSFNAWGTSRFKWPDHGGGWYMQDSSWIRSDGDKALYISRSSGSSTGIATTGRVGIGTSSPGFPLEITTARNAQSTGIHGEYFARLNSSTWSIYGEYYDNHGTKYISLRTSYGIWNQGDFFSTSDERIKENIQDVSDNVALQQLRDISCCFYEYKDKVIKGTDKTIGFIAQQVREHMPMAVSIQKGIIPNEMRKIEHPQWTTLTDASGNNTYKLTISDLEDASGNTSETTKYRFYVSNDPSGNDECEKEITSLENDPKSFIFEEQWQNVFLYGKEIDDFHTLDKNKIFAIGFSASQEIDRIQQQEKTKLEEQTSKLEAAEAKIATLENTLADVLTRLAALE